MKNLIVSIVFGCLLVWACQGDQSKMMPFDLLPYGVPMTINVPVDSPVVKQSNGFLGDKEVTVKAGNDFDLMISHIAASTSDMAKLKAEQINNVKNISTFSKIVREEDNGFVYETKVDSTHTYYGFRLIRLQGDREYIFQSGLRGTYSLEAVENMYAAVKVE